jgi:hypothetical protein
MQRIKAWRFIDLGAPAVLLAHVSIRHEFLREYLKMKTVKTVLALSVVAALAMAPAAQASGYFNKSKGLLGNVTAVLGLNDLSLLNGTTIAIGNNSSLLSNIGNGLGILGNGGQNTKLINSGNSTNVNSGNTQNNVKNNTWNRFNKRW